MEPGQGQLTVRSDRVASFERIRGITWPRFSLVHLAAVGLAAYLAIWSLLQHRSFHSNGWDLGIINQVVWNTAHGRWFEYSFRDISYAGDHWQPILLLLVPINWIWSGPEPLLIIQALALGAAVVPLYFAVSRLVPAQRAVAWALVAAYGLGLGVVRAAAFDFHAEAFVPLLLFTSLWGLATERRPVFLGCAASLLLVKEDSVLVVLAIAWLAFIAFGERWRAAGLAGLALIYGTVVNVWLMPHFRGDDLNPLAERYGYLGDTIPEIFVALVTEPALWMKQLVDGGGIAAATLVLAGVAFVPVLAPRLWPCLLLVLIPPLLSQHPAQPELKLHYMLVPAVVALVVTVLVLRDKPRWLRTKHLPAIAVGALLSAPLALYLWQSPFPPSFAAKADQFEVDHHADVSESMLREVPPDAIVSAQSAFVPHLAERIHIYQFPRVLNAKYVLVDQYGPLPPEDLAAGYNECLEALPLLGFDKTREEDGITLWVKHREAQAVPWVPEPCSGQPAAGAPS